MLSLLSKRIDDLEARLGAGLMVAVGWTCPKCGEVAMLGDLACGQHRPMPAAETTILVQFVRPHDVRQPA